MTTIVFWVRATGLRVGLDVSAGAAGEAPAPALGAGSTVA
jgi:hypothetical protein